MRRERERERKEGRRGRVSLLSPSEAAQRGGSQRRPRRGEERANDQSRPSASTAVALVARSRCRRGGEIGEASERAGRRAGGSAALPSHPR
eukprot:scaffold293487_cov30-Tisochrysis_lutea.AAC.1